MGEEAPRRKAAVQTDTKAAREMVITEPGLAQGRVAGAEDPAFGRRGSRKRHHCFDEPGNGRAGQREILVAALFLGPQEPGLDQPRDLFGSAGLAKAAPSSVTVRARPSIRSVTICARAGSASGAARRAMFGLSIMPAAWRGRGAASSRDSSEIAEPSFRPNRAG